MSQNCPPEQCILLSCRSNMYLEDRPPIVSRLKGTAATMRKSGIIMLGLLAILLCLPRSMEAQTTINAASCSSTDVQTALNSVAADNTTVILPVCTSAQK